VREDSEQKNQGFCAPVPFRQPLLHLCESLWQRDIGLNVFKHLPHQNKPPWEQPTSVPHHTKCAANGRTKFILSGCEILGTVLLSHRSRFSSCEKKSMGVEMYEIGGYNQISSVFYAAPAPCTAIIASETALCTPIFTSSDSFCASAPAFLRVLWAATGASSYPACAAT
jgi:hypothetical protein